MGPGAGKPPFAGTRRIGGNLVDTVILTDFAPYPPSLEKPAAWAVTRVAVDGAIVGAMVVELPIDARTPGSRRRPTSRCCSCRSPYSQGGWRVV